jgi:ankyrin repeat protein
MSFTVQHTKHTLDICWFLLQTCRYLIDAAKSGDVNTTKGLVSCTNDSCTTDDDKRNTPLMYAADNGHVEVVRLLLESGANAEIANTHRVTALHYGARNGSLDVCRLLLDWGATVDPVDRWKETPLHDAARKGNLSVAKLLVERGADVRVKNNNGETASDVARRLEKKAVADWLDSVSRG